MCPEHSQQLNYKKNQEALRRQRKAAKKQGDGRDRSVDGHSRTIQVPENTFLEVASGLKRRRDSETEPDLEGEMREGVRRGKSSERKAGDADRGKADGAGEDVNVWKGKQPQLKASREEEFDDYFSGMFL